MENMTITKINYDGQELDVCYQGKYSTEMDISFISNADNVDVYDIYESNHELDAIMAAVNDKLENDFIQNLY